MIRKHTYPNIDLQRTGNKLKQMLETAGYTPRMIQDYLHMEEMLVKKGVDFFAYDITQEDLQATKRRIIAYYKTIYRSVA